MGDGQGLGKSLSLEDLEDMVKKASGNFGMPSSLFMPQSSLSSFFNINFDTHPQFAGTPWAFAKTRLSKRELVVAGLHTTLSKLGALKGIEDNEFVEIRNLSIKRLKRAKWAQYSQPKRNR